MKTITTTKARTDAEVFASIRWPLIVVALLVGHASLMMVAVTFATADPPERVDGKSPIISQTDPNSSQVAQP